MEDFMQKDFVEWVLKKIYRYQGKDFQEWYYWREQLRKLDPHHPQLQVGFRGKPYTGLRD